MLDDRDKKIIFITEGGSRIGLGNLMRCIAVAECVRDLKLKPNFIVNKDRAVSHILKKYQFKFKMLTDIDKGINGYAKSIINTSVLIDSKKDLSNLIKGLRKNGCKVTLVDNVTPARLWADSVIYPFAHFDPKTLDWSRARGKVYFGAKYFPLRKEFIKTRPKKGKNYILVTMGGVDFNNLTKLVLESLNGALPNIKIVVVITKAYRCKTWLKHHRFCLKNNYEIIEDPKNFSGLLRQAGLVITALGITIYEAAYFGTPVLVINNYKADLPASRTLERIGLCKSLGYYESLESKEIIGNIKNILFSKMHKYSTVKKNLFLDGRGAQRVVRLTLR